MRKVIGWIVLISPLIVLAIFDLKSTLFAVGIAVLVTLIVILGVHLIEPK